MKTAAQYLFIAVVFAVAASIAVAGGLLQRKLAEGERSLAAFNLNQAARIFRGAHNRLSAIESLPWFLADTKRSVEARRAAVSYWRGEHAALVNEYPDIGQPEIRSNLSLQLILSSAYLRVGETSANGDRQAMLGALDQAIGIYLNVLQNTQGDRDAAFAYEYLVRLRDTLVAGDELPIRRAPVPFGRQGDTADMDMDNVNETKVYVPSDMFDREAAEDPTLGSDAPIRRRG